MATPRQPGVEVFTSRPSNADGGNPAVMAYSEPERAPEYAPMARQPVSNPFMRMVDEGRPDTAPFQDNNAAAPPMSGLAGLTVQQMVDLDVEGLAIKIDEHHCKTKKTVMDHFMDFKMRLLASQVAAVEEERRAGNARLDAKQTEMDLLKGELQQANGQGGRLAEVINRLLVSFSHSKHRTRTLGLLHRAFRGWCHHTFVSRRAKKRMQRAEQWHSKELLQRRVLKEWFRVAMQMHRVTLHNKYLGDLQQARADMESQYNGQIEQLRGQLADTRHQLVLEGAAREKLEENMKQAFMRGVCALNIEAMSVMNRGMPPGGLNPAPLLGTGRPSGPPGGPGGSGGPGGMPRGGGGGGGGPTTANNGSTGAGAGGASSGSQVSRGIASSAGTGLRSHMVQGAGQQQGSQDLEPRAALQVGPSAKAPSGWGAQQQQLPGEQSGLQLSGQPEARPGAQGAAGSRDGAGAVDHDWRQVQQPQPQQQQQQGSCGAVSAAGGLGGASALPPSWARPASPAQASTGQGAAGEGWAAVPGSVQHEARARGTHTSFTVDVINARTVNTQTLNAQVLSAQQESAALQLPAATPPLVQQYPVVGPAPAQPEQSLVAPEALNPLGSVGAASAPTPVPPSVPPPSQQFAHDPQHTAAASSLQATSQPEHRGIGQSFAFQQDPAGSHGSHWAQFSMPAPAPTSTYPAIPTQPQHPATLNQPTPVQQQQQQQAAGLSHQPGPAGQSQHQAAAMAHQSGGASHQHATGAPQPAAGTAYQRDSFGHQGGGGSQASIAPQQQPAAIAFQPRQSAAQSHPPVPVYQTTSQGLHATGGQRRAEAAAPGGAATHGATALHASLAQWVSPPPSAGYGSATVAAKGMSMAGGGASGTFAASAVRAATVAGPTQAGTTAAPGSGTTTAQSYFQRSASAAKVVVTRGPGLGR